MITINERTKAGKTLLELARLLSVNDEAVETKEESPYNLEFVEKILKAEKRGNYKTIDPDDVWGSLGLKEPKKPKKILPNILNQAINQT